ncbi:U6 small nuclear RNA (adenine-(43)-N(6))-methyltransferase [Culex pipiens pallens]|uniref:U6 small nuclear RNA (adenine-(43)-N(6))-methyltransferase n=1 Tax=Culex pipiens pallens TaxID=42434 RepID=UPI001953227F|nr:U6 small nuclear RNA (adenine-(43)-N(6))-methyltransferase [Culex pipiens pallens]
MSMSKFMHPRNIYRQKPDFNALVKQFPELRGVTTVDLNGRVKLDFKNREALQLLTRVLLRRDFGLEVELPAGKLVPTLPLRLNYILWLEDVEEALGWRRNRAELRGLDIGCGASCIYPLLGVARNRTRWKMVGLEKVRDSVESARGNVERNGLTGDVRVVEQKEGEETVIRGFLEGDGVGERFDFCMCNPPFYEQDHEVENRTGHRPEPSAVSTGSMDELRTEGGELRFVEKIIDESLELKERITVYSSMLGHKRNYDQILRILKGRGVSNFTTTRFCQGNTTRWGVAWSFSSEALLYKVPDATQQSTNTNKKSPAKPLQGKILTSTQAPTLAEAKSHLLSALTPLALQLQPSEGESDSESLWKLVAQDNTWSHQRRKRREAKRVATVESNGEPASEQGTPSKRCRTEPVLSAAVSLKSCDGGWTLALSYLGGIAGKDGVNQILQYVKNKLKESSD